MGTDDHITLERLFTPKPQNPPHKKKKQQNTFFFIIAILSDFRTSLIPQLICMEAMKITKTLFAYCSENNSNVTPDNNTTHAIDLFRIHCRSNTIQILFCRFFPDSPLKLERSNHRFLFLNQIAPQ